jgi:predicted Rossmann fold nucleotide-binding protein DprA/Smf involved in DNA uptake
VTCAGDVLELFGLALAEPKTESLGAAAEALLERLRDGALTADELVRASGVEPAAASAALVELELGRMVALEDGVYRASI